MDELHFFVRSSILTLGVFAPASAAPILVSIDQNANFGFIDPFETTLTAEEFYACGAPNAASYNGDVHGGSSTVPDTTRVFFVDASDGLALFVVHDSPNDGSGGSWELNWYLSGDTVAVKFVDDPSDTGTVTVTDVSGLNRISSYMHWTPCCTDGYVVGAFDGDWLMWLVVGAPSGPTLLGFVSADGSSVAVPASQANDIYLNPFVQASVPEPGLFGLLGAGLLAVALAYRRWRSTEAACS